MKYLEANEYLKSAINAPVIDVRSPAEYESGHIPGAINIPLFTNDERHNVGIIYKQLGRIQAIQKGLEFVGPKMSAMARQAQKLDAGAERYVYCWRGGMRSEKMAWLFELTGLQCFVLKGGYKSFRRLMMQAFLKIERPLVLQGPTGCGKTAILRELARCGEQVLDLEAIACHKGSAFGAEQNGSQPSSEQFHNDLFMALRNMDLSRRIWLEAESPTIGRVHLPDNLWQVMKKAPMVMIDLPEAYRVNRLVEEYGPLPSEVLSDNISKLKEKLGGKKVDELQGLLAREKLAEVAGGLLEYYDQSYRHSRERFHEKIVADIALPHEDAAANAQILLKEIKKLDDTKWKK